MCLNSEGGMTTAKIKILKTILQEGRITKGENDRRYHGIIIFLSIYILIFNDYLNYHYDVYFLSIKWRHL